MENTALTVDMLTSEANPLVAISLVPSAIVRGVAMEFDRFMGFICQKLRGNLRLVVTCRHALVDYDKGNQCVVCLNNPKVNPLRIIGRPILDTNEESDVAFLVVRDANNARTKPFIIDGVDIPLPEPRNLYNARNATDFNRTLCEFDITRQLVRERDEQAFVKVTQADVIRLPHSEEAQFAGLQQEGWIRCRSFQMVSRKGFSGSPIWDDDLRCYGMDIRGSDPGTKAHADYGDIAICVPNSQIYLARKRVENKIQEVASS